MAVRLSGGDDVGATAGAANRGRPWVEIPDGRSQAGELGVERIPAATRARAQFESCESASKFAFNTGWPTPRGSLRSSCSRENADLTGLPVLGPTTVHIWQVDLTLGSNGAEGYRDLLSEEENERADRFYFESDKLRFIAARATMRSILAMYLSVTPKEIVFSYGPNGKPELSPLSEKPALRFNLSHSRDRALFALTSSCRVGADIEFMDRGLATDEIARRFFAPREVAALRAVCAEDRLAAFFSFWTRKEAYVKGIGKGLSLPLHTFEVSVEPECHPGRSRISGCLNHQFGWTIYDVPVGLGYSAAIAVEGSGHRLLHKHWERQSQSAPLT